MWASVEKHVDETAVPRAIYDPSHVLACSHSRSHKWLRRWLRASVEVMIVRVCRMQMLKIQTNRYVKQDEQITRAWWEEEEEEEEEMMFLIKSELQADRIR